MAEPRVTPFGKIFSLLLVFGLIAVGMYMVKGRSFTKSGDSSQESDGSPAEVAQLQLEVPRLAPAAAYQVKDNIVPIEISEYAGYAGLIAANGGLEPNKESVFYKIGGFQVKLTVSEEESWSSLNSGALAGSVTTVDVLGVYGRQFQVVVPVQIGYSRGADGLVVRREINRINSLKGKIIAAAQFTEVDFFIRYLAQEAGLAVHALSTVDAPPDADKINLVYTEDGFSAGDLFLQDVTTGRNRLAGAVTWEPKTTEVVTRSNGQAKILTTNKNLLIISDILVLNKGFAEQHPEMVTGLVRGVLQGNRMVRDDPEAHLDVVARAFKWTREDARSELAKVHLSNLPENLAFFSGAIDAAGSFGGIYQSAVYAYGPELIGDPVDPDHFVDLTGLKAAQASGDFAGQQIAIAPIRSSARGSLENDPLLSKDIRFLFQPNSATLDLQNQDNLKNLDAIKQLLQVSPGSTILLRGHVDNAMIPEFRRQGGEAFVRQMALKAVELSKNRASEIRRVLKEKLAVDSKRLDVVGRGWEEPAGSDSEQNRRVEVQWFTVE
ncbi:MAG: phosphate ABC transporter substrate-binding/OmpA family protein [Gemmatimonadota bacterium]